MACWYYDKKELRQTPSLKDRITRETEMRYRHEGAKIIRDTGEIMKLRYDTSATAEVYFHRFYMKHSFKDYERHVVAISCLFLAGKVEETPKRVKDMARVAKETCESHDVDFSVFGDDPRQEIVLMERVVLKTIKFDLQVQHPYPFLTSFAKRLVCLNKDKQNVDIEVLQMAWTFVNDSLVNTLLCLQWEPDIVAASLLFLAGKMKKTTIDVKDRVGIDERTPWFTLLVQDLDQSTVDSICHTMVDVYDPHRPRVSRKRHAGSPPPPPTLLSRRKTDSEEVSPVTPVTPATPNSDGFSNHPAPPMIKDVMKAAGPPRPVVHDQSDNDSLSSSHDSAAWRGDQEAPYKSTSSHTLQSSGGLRTGASNGNASQPTSSSGAFSSSSFHSYPHPAPPLPSIAQQPPSSSYNYSAGSQSHSGGGYGGSGAPSQYSWYPPAGTRPPPGNPASFQPALPPTAPFSQQPSHPRPGFVPATGPYNGQYNASRRGR